MSNIGIISVSLTANMAGFTTGITAATKQLIAFGNAAKTAITSTGPLNASLGGVGTAATTTAGGMANLGKNASQAAVGLGQVSTATSASNVLIGNSAKLFQRQGESIKAFEGRVNESANTIRSKGVPAGYELKNSFRVMGDGSLQASHNIVKSTNQSIIGMFNLKKIAGMVAHYITFSIGVQMVMGVMRGIKALIGTMTDFQKECVRTAGVAGRLGGAFDSTVESIGNVAKTLGRETIFKASEAAHAMYDLASAGFDVAGAMETVKSGVAAVGPILDYAAAQQIELADATASVSRALKMFDMELEESIEVVDIFTSAIANSFLTAEKLADGLRYSGAMAHVLGISLNETVASLMSLSDAGLTGSQSGQRLNMIMTKLLKPTEKAKKTLAGLGLTIEDISPQTHTLAEIFNTLQAAGFGAGEAANFFRARTAGAAAALISNADEMERYTLTLMGAEGMTRELAEKQEKTLWGSFKLLSAAVESLALSFGDLLLPVLLRLSAFTKGKILPALEGVTNAIKAIGDKSTYLNCILKGILPTLALLVSAYATYRVAVTLSTLATKIFHNTLLKTYVAIASMTVGLTFLVGLLVSTYEASADLNDLEQKALKTKVEMASATYKYISSLDQLDKAYAGQSKAQAKLDKLNRDLTASSEDLAIAQAELAKAIEISTEQEEKFYTASARVFKVIAELSEGLNLYTEALGKLDVAEDKLEQKEKDRIDTENDILELQSDLVDANNLYGESSQEVGDIESKLAGKHKDLIDLDEEIVNLSIEVETAIDKRTAAYSDLGDEEMKVASIERDMFETEEKLKDNDVKMSKLTAKRNVLMSTRNNFERFFNERINLLREAEQKLYDVELKIYKLRHGAVDSYRELFSALTKQGIVTDDLIATYSNMEMAEGNALKEHVEYVQALDGLNDESRRSVTEWTEAYVSALDEGMSEDEAFISANKKMGISINKVSGLTANGIKEILEYAQARHVANDADAAYRIIAVALASDMVDSGQAGVDLATILHLILKNTNELESAEYDLSKANEGLTDNIRGLISSTGKLLQYWLEFGEVGEDIGAITVGMVSDMDLVSDVGADQASILKRLNSFYGINKVALEDYSHAEIVAALSAIKLAEGMEGISAATVTKEDIVHELPIDDFSEFGSVAIGVINTLELAFDGLATEIGNLDTSIGLLVKELEDLAKTEMPEIPEPDKSKWDAFFDTLTRGWANIKKGQGTPHGLEGFIPGIGPILSMTKSLMDWVFTEPNSIHHQAQAHGLARTHGPINALIGEAGAEAVVPLEGANRRFGKEILEEIIPKYFPDILRNNKALLQRGGEVNMPRTSTDYLKGTTEETTNISVSGDIIIQNPANYDAFYDELLRKLGKSKKLVL